MSAINLIDNERNMHMVPAPQPPTCCNSPAPSCGCAGGMHLSTLAGLPSSGLGLEQMVSTSVPGLPSYLGDDMLYKLSRGLPLSRPIPCDCRPPAPCLASSGPCGAIPGGTMIQTPSCAPCGMPACFPQP
mmetsp:Transcript_35108/g.42955  ORF Transcript_35108/g.42955 Transcript_35108/m.42955 type:complete len:130 (+) Transcript_35108:281-670(+)